MEPFAPCKRRRGTSIPSIYAQRLPMGPKYNVATGREELGTNISYWRSKRHSKRARVPNLAQASKSEPFAPRKSRQGTSIPSIYAQRLPMGPKYNVATGREELGSTISYWRSKRHSKRAPRVPNLAQAARMEPFAPRKRR